MSIAATLQRSFRVKKLDPYPMEILKRVDRPTTRVKDDVIKRVDERESGFNRALRGDWGAQLSKERHRFIQWSMRNIPVARNFAVWGDELLGYNQPNLKNKWWLDLEDVDGELVVPAHAGSRGNFKEPKT